MTQNMVRVNIQVKNGTEIITDINGFEVPADTVTDADVARVLDTEQWLEKMTGHRFHITIEGNEEDVVS